VSLVTVLLPKIEVSAWGFAGPCRSCGMDHTPTKVFTVGDAISPETTDCTFRLCRTCIYTLRGLCRYGEGS
jgi:hypothetical protein